MRGELPGPGALIAGTFEVRSRIGSGSMGVVLSAFDRKLERTVAIKLIRAERLDVARRARFLREARAMAQVNHPNVVSVYAYGEHRSMPYIAMEYVDGSNLDEWLRAAPRPMDVARALGILDDICRGVRAVHAAGIVHLDLKPSNILLDTALRCRIADFGVSMRPPGDVPERVGTPGYMAPETLLASRYGPTSVAPVDVYALGCIAYEMLTGSHPFRRLGEQLLAPVSAREILPPSRRCPGLPKALDRVIVPALAWDGSRRPSLETFQQGLLEVDRGRAWARARQTWAWR
jgi:eukaryotic-like serine/threonine-protein kinase